MRQWEQREFWENTGLAVHNLENNIDLQDYEMNGKPHQFFNLLELLVLTGRSFERKRDNSEQAGTPPENVRRLRDRDEEPIEELFS